MKKLLLLFFIALFATAHSQEQGDADFPAPRSTISLLLDAEGFFFDAEYGTPYAKGYTVTGFRLSPTLVYGINKKAQLRVGLNAMMFAGLDSLYKLRPTLTLLYQPASWLTFIAGTLLDNNHHQLPAPVVDPARHIYNYQEDGIQILTKTKIWQSDTWLDWTHYLTPWTPDQEFFTMGTKHSLRILHLTGSPLPANYRDFSLYIPFHFLADHRGGEVKTIDTNTVTTFNENVGLRFEYSFGTDREKPSSIVLNLPVFFYHLEDTELDHPGKAFYPSLTLSVLRSPLSALRLSLGYWHGDHYFSAHGSPLFWSANSYSRLHMPASSSYVDADIRNLITYSLSLEHSFKEVTLGLKVDALHDLDLKNNDFIFSFFLRHNGQLKIL